ncbi:MAG: DMT family transporter [Chloroflexi bacterium]|nr:DMT family transporter [Chloroflexota bacterium]
MERQAVPLRGVVMALATPVFLGVAPIFGKMALHAGADPFSVAALRTLTAIAVLWAVYAVFLRRFIFVSPAGLMGCVTIGIINGVGALCYYSGLGRLDAGLVQAHQRDVFGRGGRAGALRRHTRRRPHADSCRAGYRRAGDLDRLWRAAGRLSRRRVDDGQRRPVRWHAGAQSIRAV